MAEKEPRREVRSYAERTMFWDGQLYKFMNIVGTPYIDRQGRRIIKFRLQTDEITRKAYNIKKEECDEDNCVELVVNADDVFWANEFDESRRALFYVKTFRGDDTIFNSREAFWKNEAQKKDAKILQREAEVMALREENTIIKTNPIKHMKQYGELAKDMISGYADVMLKKKEDTQ